jgi:hypothetical protein
MSSWHGTYRRRRARPRTGCGRSHPGRAPRGRFLPHMVRSRLPADRSATDRDGRVHPRRRSARQPRRAPVRLPRRSGGGPHPGGHRPRLPCGKGPHRNPAGRHHRATRCGTGDERPMVAAPLARPARPEAVASGRGRRPAGARTPRRTRHRGRHLADSSDTRRHPRVHRGRRHRVSRLRGASRDTPPSPGASSRASRSCSSHRRPPGPPRWRTPPCPGCCSARTGAAPSPPGSANSNAAGPWSAALPRPNAAASKETCTTAPSNASSP